MVQQLGLKLRKRGVARYSIERHRPPEFLLEQENLRLAYLARTGRKSVGDMNIAAVFLADRQSPLAPEEFGARFPL